MQSGINYFYNLLSLDPTIFDVYYDFNESGSAIPSISQANPLFSGVLSSVGNFFQTSGRGYFTGQNVQITNDTGLYSPNWTMMFVYEKTDSGAGVLFSNYHGDPIRSGFAIGVNDANKLYFETWTNQGPQVLEADLLFTTRNAVSLTFAGNGLHVSLFNFNLKTVESQNFSLDSSFVFQSTGWYLGAAPNPPAYFSGRSWHGFIDTFLYFGESLLPYQVTRLFSGLYSTGDGVYNMPYVCSFGMDGISFVEEVLSDDWVDAFTAPSGTDKTNINLEAVFDKAYGDFVLLQSLSATGINTYVNGLAEVPSGYSTSGNVYNTSYILSGDFVISGQEVFSNNTNTISDEMIYDAINGARSLISVPANYFASGGFTFAPIEASGSMVFLNGMRLRSGVDYQLQNSDIWMTNANLTGISGWLFTFPVDPDTQTPFVGTFNNHTGARFAKGASQAWLNGIRQEIGLDYVETSAIDLLNGSGSYPEAPLIFNNEQLFWT